MGLIEWYDLEWDTCGKPQTKRSLKESAGSYAVIIFDHYQGYIASTKTFATFDEAQNYLKEEYLEVREEVGKKIARDLDDRFGYNPKTNTFDGDGTIDQFYTVNYALDKPVSYDLVDLSKGRFVVYHMVLDSFGEGHPEIKQFNNNEEAQKYLQNEFLNYRYMFEDDEDSLEEYDDQTGYIEDDGSFDEIQGFTTRIYGSEDYDEFDDYTLIKF